MLLYIYSCQHKMPWSTQYTNALNILYIPLVNCEPLKNILNISSGVISDSKPWVKSQVLCEWDLSAPDELELGLAES